ELPIPYSLGVIPPWFKHHVEREVWQDAQQPVLLAPTDESCFSSRRECVARRVAAPNQRSALEYVGLEHAQERIVGGPGACIAAPSRSIALPRIVAFKNGADGWANEAIADLVAIKPPPDSYIRLETLGHPLPTPCLVVSLVFTSLLYG